MKAALFFLTATGCVQAQAPANPPPQSSSPSLSAISAGFQELSRRVQPSVVKVTSIGYRQLEESESGESGVAARQQSAGSGVIIYETGLIVTNADVVIGAQKVLVTFTASTEVVPQPKGALLRPAGRAVRAEVLGLDLETDVALLRVQEKGLIPLRLGDSDSVAQGQIVLAFGSPMGLDNSVTMGVVSCPARQLKPDAPMIDVQTDAPINPGNGGGPLVNADGQVVGINTLILTQSGGSEGIGFAVPSNIVLNVVEQLRKSGRVVRVEIGVLAQTIIQPLASGWKLHQAWGVVIADVEPGGSGDQAGLKAGDIILSLNGKLMENARQFNANVYRPAIGETVTLEVLRGHGRLTVPVKIEERQEEASVYAGLASREENLISELGLFAVDLTPLLLEQVSPTRRQSGGVLVVSKSADPPILEEGFQTGDLILAVNRTNVMNAAELRSLLKRMKPGDSVALQVERGGKLRFIAFELL